MGSHMSSPQKAPTLLAWAVLTGRGQQQPGRAWRGGRKEEQGRIGGKKGRQEEKQGQKGNGGGGEGAATCLVKSCTMLCSETWEPMAKRRFSCFSMRVSISWSSWLVKPSTPAKWERGGLAARVGGAGERMDGQTFLKASNCWRWRDLQSPPTPRPTFYEQLSDLTLGVSSELWTGPQRVEQDLKVQGPHLTQGKLKPRGYTGRKQKIQDWNPRPDPQVELPKSPPKPWVLGYPSSGTLTFT